MALSTVTTCDGCDKRLQPDNDGSAHVVVMSATEAQEQYDICAEQCFVPAVKRRRDAQAKAAQA